MDNCEKIRDLVRKSRSVNGISRGISVKKIAGALKIDDATVYRHLDTLQNEFRLDRGIVYPIDEKIIQASGEARSLLGDAEQTVKPGFLSRLTNWLSTYQDRKAERKDRESRIRKYRIAVGWQKIWLCRQKLNDNEFMNRMGRMKLSLQKQYGLEHDYD